MWYRPKDVNYYDRLAILSKVRKIIKARLEMFQSIPFNPPIPYSYNGGKRTLELIERYEYYSCFKRTFSVIRCKVSDGTYVKLEKLRMKHLLKIYQVLSSKI
jgi:hypothetical protein